MANDVTDDLSYLIDNPQETLGVELKAWLDLSNPVHRANIARHICAMANYGGGHIVFGFDDNLSPSEDAGVASTYNRDSISAIVKRYLTPPIQCAVHLIRNRSGADFAVIVVPGHGRMPVVAKADGPQDRGRPQGILQGVHYIRQQGPESAPITVNEWGPLIRRCLVYDRESLLQDISSLVQPRLGTSSGAYERLDSWDERTNQRFIGLVSEPPSIDWRVPLIENSYRLSYTIVRDPNESIPPRDLVKVLKDVNRELQDTVRTGWSMFYPFDGDHLRPALMAENSDGSGDEVLEANLLGDGSFDISLPDYWRVSSDGRASIVRAYREDRTRSELDTGRTAGTWLSPETVVRETTEFLTHAKLLARNFASATSVQFKVTWSGLRRRHIEEFDRSVYWRESYFARENRRVVRGEWTPTQLAGMWDVAVADLSCPVLRLFGLEFCSAEFVRGMEPRFKKY